MNRNMLKKMIATLSLTTNLCLATEEIPEITSTKKPSTQNNWMFSFSSKGIRSIVPEEMIENIEESKNENSIKNHETYVDMSIQGDKFPEETKEENFDFEVEAYRYGEYSDTQELYLKWATKLVPDQEIDLFNYNQNSNKSGKGSIRKTLNLEDYS